MLNSARHDEALFGSKIDRAVFQIDQETSIDHVKEFVDVRVLVPVIFAFDDSEAHNGVIHSTQRLVPPFVGAVVHELLHVDQLQRPVQNVQVRLVGKIVCLASAHDNYSSPSK